MRILPFVLLLLFVTPAEADPVGIRCDVQLGPQAKPEVWHLSFVPEQRLYTARLNNAVVRQRQPVEPIMGFPEVTGLQFQVDISPMQKYFIVYKNGDAFITALAIANQRRVGKCVEDKFLGL